MSSEVKTTLHTQKKYILFVIRDQKGKGKGGGIWEANVNNSLPVNTREKE
jgi:hypothetical protein